MRKKEVIFKATLCLVVALAVGLAIAATRAADKKPPDLWTHVHVKGSEKWFTLAQLREVSDAHLLKREPKLDLHKFEVTANVFADDRAELVMFHYFENFGLPVFRITLNKSGEVADYNTRIASEGSKVTTPILPSPTKKPSL